MNPKRTKEKERRRARKLAEQAWDAAEQENLDLAEKIIRRAVATQPENPVLWNDQGMVLALRGKGQEAEESFRSALSLAPSYAEPCGHLAALRADQGYLLDAIRLLEQAVQHAPDVAQYAERLETYRALVTRQVPQVETVTTAPPMPPVPSSSPWDRKVAAPDWPDFGERLTRDGHVRIPQLVDPETCARLRHLFDEDSLFAKTVVMNRDDFGRGTYRYFRAPIPEVVDGLRRSVFPHVARIANHWQSLLGEAARFPEDWEGFRSQCQEAGQTTPTPILLKYEAGGFNALHRDLRGSMYFPLQMAVVLSERVEDAAIQEDSFRGGEFLFCDVPEGKKARRRVIPAGLGDAVLFCTRDRLIAIGGAYGLQPVKHGVEPITAGTRFVLGVPFHEYR